MALFLKIEIRCLCKVKKTKKSGHFFAPEADLIWASSGKTSKKRVKIGGFFGFFRSAHKEMQKNGSIFSGFRSVGALIFQLLSKIHFSSKLTRKSAFFCIFGGFSRSGANFGVLGGKKVKKTGFWGSKRGFFRGFGGFLAFL